MYACWKQYCVKSYEFKQFYNYITEGEARAGTHKKRRPTLSKVDDVLRTKVTTGQAEPTYQNE